MDKLILENGLRAIEFLKSYIDTINSLAQKFKVERENYETLLEKSQSNELISKINIKYNNFIREHLDLILENKNEFEKAKKNKILFEEEELKDGIKVESEHKNTYKKIQDYYNKSKIFPAEELIFEWIANDHLKEIADYYTGLKKMEDNAKNEKI